MLVILVGATLEIAKKSRDHFVSRDFGLVEKMSYFPSNDSISSHLGFTKSCTKEEIDNCYLISSNEYYKTGFDRSQILDAVKGRTNKFMTAVPDDLDFVRQIKDSFGDCIRLVYLHIDKYSYESMLRKYIIFEEEIHQRLKKREEHAELFSREMGLFDKVVVYEENSPIGCDALFMQYDRIIKEAKQLNDKLFVEFPYKGSEDYIFVSYSRADEEKVLPILSELHKEGYRIWYDEGIHGGINWRVMLGDRLDGSTDFLMFSSENSSKSKNVYAEVGMALDKEESHPIVVRLDDALFPTGYEMYLKEYQNIFVKNGNVIEELKNALSPSTRV